MAKAHTYIDQKLYDHMDIFTDVTRPFSNAYSHRASQLQSIVVGKKHMLKQMKGEWAAEIVETLDVTFRDVDQLQQLGCFEGSDRGKHNCVLRITFSRTLCQERLYRLVPQIFDYPGIGLLVLDPDDAARAAARKHALAGLPKGPRILSNGSGPHGGGTPGLEDFLFRLQSIVVLRETSGRRAPRV